jgi:hypothetical protein
MRRAFLLLAVVLACGKEAPPADNPKPEPSTSPSQLIPDSIASSVPSSTASAAPTASIAPAPTTTSTSVAPPGSAALYLLDIDKKASTKPNAVKVGCDDFLVPKMVKLTKTEKKDQLEEALTMLFAEMKEKLTPKVTTVKEGESYAVNITGSLKFGGTCDVPRKVGMITNTAEQFGKIQYSLNGSASAWRCLGDESGKCK